MNQHETASVQGLALADGNVAALAWRDAWRLQARNHPWMTGGLGLALAAMALLLGAGIRDGLSSGGEPLRLALRSEERRVGKECRSGGARDH